MHSSAALPPRTAPAVLSAPYLPTPPPRLITIAPRAHDGLFSLFFRRADYFDQRARVLRRGDVKWRRDRAGRRGAPQAAGRRAAVPGYSSIAMGARRGSG